jgi:carbon-monoxide dehydrogenase medium subunit
MYPAPFEYHRAGSVEEAVALLERYQEDAKLLAGGHSLLPIMKLRFAEPKHLIDIRRIPRLAGIQAADGGVAIGAVTTHGAVASSALIRSRLPILAEAAGQIGDPLVRNMGTIGGSVAHADPGADFPAVLLALEATLVATGPGGTRTIAAQDFFKGLLTTALEPNEVLTEIRIRAPQGKRRVGAAYEKYPHPASRYAVVGVAALLDLSGSGAIDAARIAITGLGTRPARLAAVERALVGKAPTDAVLADAARRAGEGIELRADVRESEEYRKQLAAVYTRRALTRAAERARG